MPFKHFTALVKEGYAVDAITSDCSLERYAAIGATLYFEHNDAIKIPTLELEGNYLMHLWTLNCVLNSLPLAFLEPAGEMAFWCTSIKPAFKTHIRT